MRVQDEHQRHVETALAQHGQQQRAVFFARRLKDGDRDEADRRGQHRPAYDAQKSRAVGDGLVAVDERAYERFGAGQRDRQTYQRKAECACRHEQHGRAHSPAVAGRVVVADQRQRALRYALSDRERSHIDALCDADAGDRRVAIRRHEIVDDEVGAGRQHGHQTCRKPDRHHRKRRPARKGGFDRSESDHSAQFEHEHDEVERGDAIGDERRQRRAGHPHAQAPIEDEQGVERDVEDAAERQTYPRMHRLALGAHQMGEHGREHGRDGAGDDRVDQVVDCILQSHPVRSERGQERFAEQSEHEREHRRDRNAAPYRERGRAPRPVGIARAECARHHRRAAYSEQVGGRGQEHIDGQAQRDRRDHRLVAQPADKEGVGEVVDDRDQLADHRRQYERDDRLGDGRLFEDVFFLFGQTCLHVYSIVRRAHCCQCPRRASNFRVGIALRADC